MARESLEEAGIKDDPKSPLFRASNGKTKILSDRALDREDAFHMVRRRARLAGIETKIGCHTFRASLPSQTPRCKASVSVRVCEIRGASS
jgi:hypothetical protein